MTPIGMGSSRRRKGGGLVLGSLLLASAAWGSPAAAAGEPAARQWGGVESAFDAIRRLDGRVRRRERLRARHEIAKKDLQERRAKRKEIDRLLSESAEGILDATKTETRSWTREREALTKEGIPAIQKRLAAEGEELLEADGTVEERLEEIRGMMPGALPALKEALAEPARLHPATQVLLKDLKRDAEKPEDGKKGGS